MIGAVPACSCGPWDWHGGSGHPRTLRPRRAPRTTPSPGRRHCCIKRSPSCDCLHFAATRRQIMGTVVVRPFLASFMKASTLLGLPRHIPAQCNSADASHRPQCFQGNSLDQVHPAWFGSTAAVCASRPEAPNGASRSCARSARPFGWSCSTIQATCRGAAGPLRASTSRSARRGACARRLTGSARARPRPGRPRRRARRAASAPGARQRLKEGVELARRVGAFGLAGRANEEIAATGARPRTVLQTGLDALTASERRVGQLAADGMTNKEIAQTLFVTINTVEVLPATPVASSRSAPARSSKRPLTASTELGVRLGLIARPSLSGPGKKH